MFNKTFANYLKSILYLDIINHLPVANTGCSTFIIIARDCKKS